MTEDMKLTAENVDRLFLMLLFQEGESLDNPVVVEGIVAKFGFHPVRTNVLMPAISGFLNQLPDDFKHGKGGGMSFLCMCHDADGVQWGEHRDMEKLLAMGLACGLVKYTLSREMWAAMPSGMPYLTVYQPKDLLAEKSRNA